MAESKFWIVWNPMRGNPVKQFEDEKQARDEAERLAIKEKNPVYVLVAIGRYAPVEQPVEWMPL